MKKKIHYSEPKMPDSLKELLEVEEPKKSLKRPPSKGAKNRKNARPGAKPAGRKKPAGSKRPSVSSSAKKPAGSSVKPAKKKVVKKKRADIDDLYYRNKSSKTSKNIQSKKNTSKVSGKSGVKKKTKKKSGKPGIMSMILYGILTFFNFVKTGGDPQKSLSNDKKEKMDISFYRIFSLVFMTGIVFMGLAIMIHKDADKSVAENRTLMQKPHFSMESFIDGKYSDDYATYLSDQFPDRTNFVKIKAKVDRLIGKDEINGVYICKDGYLMEGFQPSEKSVTKEKVDAVNRFAKNHPKLNTTLMLVPNKVSIYSNLLPKYAPVGSQREYSDSVKKMLANNVKYVELFDDFEKNKNGMQLYFKTDHHWNTDGAYLGYLDYCKKVDIQPVSKDTFQISLASDSFLGSLYYKNGAQIGSPENLYLYIDMDNPPILVKYFDDKKKVPSLYSVKGLEGHDPYEVFTGGNHSQIKVRTATKTNRKLLLIKDSYANAMLPFLAYNYSEITVIDPRYYKGSMNDVLNNNEFTDVLVLQNINTFNTDTSILSINE